MAGTKLHQTRPARPLTTPSKSGARPEVSTRAPRPAAAPSQVLPYAPRVMPKMTIYPEPEMASRTPGPALQRTFDHSSVYDALMTAQGAWDMGGTTGGAYRVPTASEDPERKILVVKVSGDTEDLAAKMGETLGLVLPRAIKIHLDEPLLAAFGKVSASMRGQIESKRKHDILVQQFVGPDIPLANEALREKQNRNETLGKIAMFDFLLGNRDRFTNQTADNILGTIPIDNKVSKHRDEMAPTLSGLLENSAEISPYVDKQINRTSGSNLQSRRDKLEVQKGILGMLLEIQGRSKELQGLVDDDAVESGKRYEQILAAFAAIQEGEVLGTGSNKGKDVDPSILNQELQGLSKDLGFSVDQIIKNNAGSFKDKLAAGPKGHQSALRKTIDDLAGVETERILGALKTIDGELDKLDQQDLKRHLDWRAARTQAQLSAKKKWDDKWAIAKAFLNEQTTIKELMDAWLRVNPEPWLPPHLRD